MVFKEILPSLLKSTSLHIALVVVLVLSTNFQSSEPKVLEVQLNSPQELANNKQAVEAISVDQKAVNQRIEELKKQDAEKKRTEQQRLRDLEKRAENAKKQREEEARRIKKLEQQRKQKELEKKEADVAAAQAQKKQQDEQKKAKQAEDEKLKSQKAAQDALAERKKQEEALKKAEQERLKKEAEAKAEAERKRRQAQEEQMLQEQLAQEQAARNRAKRQQVLTEVEKYQAMIQARIQQNLLQDEKMKGKQCKVNIKLAFNGLVTQVESLGGDKLVCEAVIRAIRMAETLPVSKDKDVFEQLKNINLTFKPEL
ncbi:colicin import membrane protein [Pseudoalteromonas tunicata]|uniref:Putative TolA protein n=1 Tax=Pseudoalteromonas tunicata D2 TaxID=87626 RepID=A4CFI0_9GAMM|nr:colicin import membrane protein [Pseudoalteromonas tunicata]EAR26518.1 putative TolA protein [Pseudoalteromonas tunicata D2]